jgi:hypothetical protein
VKVTVTVVDGGVVGLSVGNDVPLNVTVPVYVPAESPEEFAVMVRYWKPLVSEQPFTAFPPAFRHPDVGHTVSHGALVVAVQLSVEP